MTCNKSSQPDRKWVRCGSRLAPQPERPPPIPFYNGSVLQFILLLHACFHKAHPKAVLSLAAAAVWCLVVLRVMRSKALFILVFWHVQIVC